MLCNYYARLIYPLIDPDWSSDSYSIAASTPYSRKGYTVDYENWEGMSRGASLVMSSMHFKGQSFKITIDGKRITIKGSPSAHTVIMAFTNAAYYLKNPDQDNGIVKLGGYGLYLRIEGKDALHLTCITNIN